MADRPHGVLLLAEDRGASENAELLGDRALLACADSDDTLDWVDDSTIGSFRSWIREDLHGFAARGPRVHGTYRERDNDERMFRQLLAAISRLPTDPPLVIIAKDSDHKDLRAGFDAAKARVNVRSIIVLAEMRPESEAWRVLALAPDTGRMTSGKDGPYDAKRILASLGGEEAGLEALRSASLDALRQLPGDSGLPAFLDEVTQAFRALA